MSLFPQKELEIFYHPYLLLTREERAFLDICRIKNRGCGGTSSNKMKWQIEKIVMRYAQKQEKSPFAFAICELFCQKQTFLY